VVGTRKLREGSVGFFYTSPPVVGVGLVGLFWKVQDRADRRRNLYLKILDTSRAPVGPLLDEELACSSYEFDFFYKY
jgi:hypothetical protein